MRILINNLVTADTLTVNEEQTSFPKENMISNQLIKKTYFEDYIDIDLGSAKLIKAIALVSQDTGITVSANSTPAWGSPPFTTTITKQVTFINQTYRYWRIAKTGSNKINYFSLSQYLQLDCLEPGSQGQPNSTDQSNISVSGQVYTTRGITFKTQTFRFPLATAAEFAEFDDWWYTDDRTNAHFIVPWEDDTDMEEFFGVISNYTIPNRDKLVYDYKFDALEAK